MPFKSKAQQRFMFSAESKGELPKGTAERWAEHTPDIKALPEHKTNKTAAEIADAVLEKIAMSDAEFEDRYLKQQTGMTKAEFDVEVARGYRGQLKGLTWGLPIGAGAGVLGGLALSKPLGMSRVRGAGAGGLAGAASGALTGGLIGNFTYNP
jgi:hypothetical protein